MATKDPQGGDGRDDERERERARAQVRTILEAFDGQVGVYTGRSTDLADFEYLYRQGSILARDADVGRVLEVLDGRASRADDLVDGVTRIDVRPAGDGDPGELVPDVLDLLDRRVGLGVATPDHVLYVTIDRCCPATEPDLPDPAAAEPPWSKGSTAGAGVMVSVVDTGWWPDAETDPASPWLVGVTGDPETIDLADIHAYAGHGTFIAGIIRCLAPETEVRVEGFLPTAGAVFESEMVKQLVEALALGPDVISLSAGATTRGSRPSLSFEVFHEKFLSQVSGTVMVAAAGNDGVRRPFWPAAFPWTISVGALDAQRSGRADYSNFGSWVDLYAPGTDLVNAYPRGVFVTKEPTVGQSRDFTDVGLCSWSGTSFSTPYVAARIAEEMSTTGLGARLAADRVLKRARANAVPGVGPVLT